jgi:hypothetical protein
MPVKSSKDITEPFDSRLDKFIAVQYGDVVQRIPKADGLCIEQKSKCTKQVGNDGVACPETTGA